MKVLILVEFYHSSNLTGEGIWRYMAPWLRLLRQFNIQMSFVVPQGGAMAVQDYVRELQLEADVVVWSPPAEQDFFVPRSNKREFRSLKSLVKRSYGVLNRVLQLILRDADFSVKKWLVQKFDLGSRSRSKVGYSPSIEFARFASAIKFDVLFSPSPSFQSFSYIQGRKVLLCPDFLFVEPVARDFLPKAAFDDLYRRFQASLEAADRVICYSNFVKENHLRHFDFLAPVDVIPHGLFTAQKSVLDPITILKNRNSSIATCIHGYIFVSTQDRVTKNLEVVIQALELLKRRGYPVKLVLTAKELMNATKQVVQSLGVDKEIIVAPCLSEEEHTAVMGGALCSVHSSLFEGGLTSIVSESISLGVPVVISAIPSSMEVLHFCANETLYFDPKSSEQLADRIENIIQFREDVISEQIALVDSAREKYNWKTVCSMYVDSFKRATQDTYKV